MTEEVKEKKEMEYGLYMTIDEFNLVLNALGEVPARFSFNLINKINARIQSIYHIDSQPLETLPKIGEE